MNERIQELVRESNLDVYGLGKERYKWEYTVEKFAELIVDECCLKLLDMDEKTNGRHNYYKHAALELKRHVGVEE